MQTVESVTRATSSSEEAKYWIDAMWDLRRPKRPRKGKKGKKGAQWADPEGNKGKGKNIPTAENTLCDKNKGISAGTSDFSCEYVGVPKDSFFN